MLELIMDVWGGGGGVRWGEVEWCGVAGWVRMYCFPYPTHQPHAFWLLSLNHFWKYGRLLVQKVCTFLFVLLLASVRYLLPMIFTSIFHTSLSVHPSPLWSKPAPLVFFPPYAWFVNRCSWINANCSFLTFTGILRLGSVKNVLWKQHDF